MPDKPFDPDAARRLAEGALARAEKATPEPWCAYGTVHDNLICQHSSNNCDNHPVLWARDDHLEGHRDDKLFVAAARGDVPQLARALLDALNELERMKAHLERAKKTLDMVHERREPPEWKSSDETRYRIVNQRPLAACPAPDKYTIGETDA